MREMQTAEELHEAFTSELRTVSSAITHGHDGFDTVEHVTHFMVTLQHLLQLAETVTQHSRTGMSTSLVRMRICRWPRLRSVPLATPLAFSQMGSLLSMLALKCAERAKALAHIT